MDTRSTLNCNLESTRFAFWLIFMVTFRRLKRQKLCTYVYSLPLIFYSLDYIRCMILEVFGHSSAYSRIQFKGANFHFSV